MLWLYYFLWNAFKCNIEFYLGNNIWFQCFHWMTPSVKLLNVDIITPVYQCQLSSLTVNEVCWILWPVLSENGCLMPVRKVSSQISLCSPHKLIRDDTFRFYVIFCYKKVSSKQKYSECEKKVWSLISLCGLHRLI